MMRVRRLLALSPVGAALLAAVAGCAGHGAVRQDVSGSDGYQQGNLALTFISASHRHQPSTVTGTLLDGGHFDLSAWRGKVVVVNFWESDCAPCRSEAQALEQVYENDKSKGVEFLGVNIRDSAQRARAFDAHFGVTYPSLNDPSNLVALRFRGAAPNATPTTIVLDRQGRIAARQSGEILFTQLRDLVDRVLAEPA